MSPWFHRVAERLAGGKRVAIASIARRRGSSPRSQGTRCAVLEDGTVWGTIGGGVLEAQVRKTAVDALASETICYLEMHLDASELAEDGMICGGSVDILVVPWGPTQARTAQAADELLGESGRGSLVTVWKGGGSAWEIGLRTEDRWIGCHPVFRGLDEAIDATERTQMPSVLGDASAGALVEPLIPEKTPLVVLGAGHVGTALARLASLAGFSVTVVDDRAEFASERAVPWADRVQCRPFVGTFREVATDPDTFVVVCTRGHLSDAVCAEEALRTQARYVGVIGSRRKRAATVARLMQAGVPEARLETFRMPVGLPIGAETPEEIAVSIVAEMVEIRASGKKQPAFGPDLPLSWDSAQGRIFMGDYAYLLIRPQTLGPACGSQNVAVREALTEGGRRGGILAAKAVCERGQQGKEAVREVLSMGGRIGWGRFDLVHWAPDRVVVEVRHSPLAEAAAPSAEPVCHLVRGVLSGVVSHVTGAQVQAQEAACTARGDGACRFELRLQRAAGEAG